MGVLRVSKLSIVLITFSVCLFVLTLYLNPNQIVGRKDLKMPKIEVPELPKLSERKEFQEHAIRSPFGERELLAIPKATTPARVEIQPPKVTMVYKGRDAYVLFGEEIRKEGETIGDFVVERIRDGKVLLKRKKGGKEIWVNVDGF